MWQTWSQVRYMRQLEIQVIYICTQAKFQPIIQPFDLCPPWLLRYRQVRIRASATNSTLCVPFLLYVLHLCSIFTLPLTHSDTPYRSMKTSSLLRYSHRLRNRRTFWMTWVICNCQSPNSVLINMGACHVACRQAPCTHRRIAGRSHCYCKEEGDRQTRDDARGLGDAPLVTWRMLCHVLCIPSLPGTNTHGSYLQSEGDSLFPGTRIFVLVYFCLGLRSTSKSATYKWDSTVIKFH